MNSWSILEYTERRVPFCYEIMATFEYKAHRADQKPIEGHIDADDLEFARLALEEQGLIVSSIHPVETRTTDEPGLQRQVDRVLATGKFLAPALRAYAQELPAGKRRHRLQQIANQLEQGHGPSNEIEDSNLDAEWIQLRIMGASADDPSRISGEIVNEFLREDDLRGQFAMALAYPLVMLAASLSVLLFITVWIIPVFREMFLDFELQLPAATQFILGLSHTIQLFWWAFLISAIVLSALLIYHPRIRNWIVERIPFVGSTIRLSDQAKFTRYLANLLEAEIPISEALRISGQSIGTTNFSRASNDLATKSASADTDAPASPSARRQLPHTVVHALQMDAHPHAAAQILRELSWMYDQQTRNRLAWMPGFIEPVFIILLGSAVGFYVVALFMPLVNLLHGLSG